MVVLVFIRKKRMLEYFGWFIFVMKYSILTGNKLQGGCVFIHVPNFRVDFTCIFESTVVKYSLTQCTDL